MTMGLIELGIIIGISIIQAVALIAIGFYLGRLSRVTIPPVPPEKAKPFDPGPQGVHEYDAFAVAMGDQKDIKDLK